MNELLDRSNALIQGVSLDFQRSLLEEVRWNNRLIGIKGARGTGKTTLLLQWLKLRNQPADKAAYFTLDDLYFTTHSLRELAREFYLNGGKILVLDEVHRYPNWSMEIKNLYDLYPDLRIVFTGSSVVDITRQEADLSRRALMYELPGLSYREFLAVSGAGVFPVLDLSQLCADASIYRSAFPTFFHPLEAFNRYLRIGYYPIFLEDEMVVQQRIRQMVRVIIENDMSAVKDFDLRNSGKLLQLLYILSQQVPFKPNLTDLAAKTGIHRNTLNTYLYYLEQARLIHLLRPAGITDGVLQKPEKIYLDNPSVLFALAESEPNKGNLRETFFLSQLKTNHQVRAVAMGDFLVDNKFTFEIGGKSKTEKQVRGLASAFIVKDDIEWPIGKAIPLWMFGMLY